VWGAQDARPGLAVACGNLYGDRRPYLVLPPFKSSIVSPKEKKR
jgi:hypothetical protein